MLILLPFMLLHGLTRVSSFSPDKTDYDAYGLKIAANDVLYVQSNGNGATFLVQFAPYNYTMGSLQCSISYDDSTHYVYSVGVGQLQNTTQNPYFYFSGEVASDSSGNVDSTGNNGTFIGILVNKDPLTVQNYIMQHQSLSCDYFEVDHLQFLSSYGHQEFFVMAVEPYGQYAIGLATQFGFIYSPFSSNIMTSKPGSAIWPNSSMFNPCAADTYGAYTIVAGFLGSSARSRVRATPTVYLMSNSNLTVLSSWSYSPTNSSWQSRLTYSSANTWNSQHTMSVKINVNDPTRVLVGMPFLNTVFLFVVSNNGASLTMTSSLENGQNIGFGKSVAWLRTSQAAILSTSYSLDFQTWFSTNIYMYTSFNGTVVPSSPTASFPNAQQPLPSTINSKLIRLVSTPSSVATLDVNGGAIIILSGLPGTYPSTDTTNSPIAAAMPVVSHSVPCIGGTYKSTAGIHPCNLCPTGSRNPGGMSATSCVSCAANSFCPLGALYEMNSTVLESVSQAYAYPRPPEMNVYEDILLNNMFTIGSSGHCLMVSPLFWTIIVLAAITLLIIVMASLHWFVQPYTRDRLMNIVKRTFEKTDLIQEGELWIGGLVSIAVVLMGGMAYFFAVSYLNQYPSEKVRPSTFACDETIRNAKFDTSLQALAVPLSEEEQPMFDYLDQQNFTFYIDFINTAAKCPSLLMFEVTDIATVPLMSQSCSDMNGTLSATVNLPQHAIVLKIQVMGIALIGAVRIGLSGPGVENGSTTLKELNFRKTFYSQTPRTFAQSASIGLELTKVINETEPLESGDSEFSGIWYPTYTYSLNGLFMTAESYAMFMNLTLTTLTVKIAETSYYIRNIQQPIAKQAEIIFRTLLFTILCLELCALVFVIFKLLIIPILSKISAKLCPHFINTVEPEHEMKWRNE